MPLGRPLRWADPSLGRAKLLDALRLRFRRGLGSTPTFEEGIEEAVGAILSDRVPDDDATLSLVDVD